MHVQKKPSKSVFRLQGVSLSKPEKKCLNRKEINRLTEQKTGDDVNKNKSETEKEEEEEDGRRKENTG